VPRNAADGSAAEEGKTEAQTWTTGANMGVPTEKRLEWERLLTGHQVDRAELPRNLQKLLEMLDQKLGPRNVPHKSPQTERKETSATLPSAGPHARPELTNRDLTPGTGMLPDPESHDPNMQPSG